MSKKLEDRLAQLESEVKIKDLELMRYRAELNKANERLERLINDYHNELHQALRLQKLLTPTEIPHITGVEFSTKYVSGTETGGDYFDIFELEDKMRFGLLIANSSGYAMSALFLTVLMKLSSVIEARKGMKPELVVQKIAEEVRSSMKEKDSASVFYAILDRRTFDMEYCSVGQIGPYLYHSESGKTARIESSGDAIRAQSVGPALSQKISLNSKDRLVVVSPGVLDARNPQGQAWGLDGVSKALQNAKKGSVHDVRNEVLFQSEQYMGQAESPKDRTVVVLEIKDKVIKLAKSDSGR